MTKAQNHAILSLEDPKQPMCSELKHCYFHLGRLCTHSVCCAENIFCTWDMMDLLHLSGAGVSCAEWNCTLFFFLMDMCDLHVWSSY